MVRLPKIDSGFIDNHEYFMLFETRLFDSRNFMTYLFVDPVRIIKAKGYKEIKKALNDIDRYSGKFYLAGYLAYELGYYFENIKFNWDKYSGVPLIHLVVFDKRFYFNHKTGKTNMDRRGIFLKSSQRKGFYIRNLKLDITPEEYRYKILKIKEKIRRKDTSQVNFTARYNFELLGSVFEFYKELSNRQNVQYGAFCKLKDQLLVSLSPELFFRREGDKITSLPMKGTIKRGRDAQEDRENIIKLKRSLKDRAENSMIVDLIRSDLGKVSKGNSIKVSELFRVRKYDTLFQMTSQVDGTLKKGIAYTDIFRNIFPGGSVTGVPKKKTIEIIKGLESSLRGVYCGALGFIAKRKEAIFNLPIRTISIFGNKAQMGVGSGVVYGSSPIKEFKECSLKADFLTKANYNFKLIETILWDRGFKFLREHLNRIRDSASYFGYSYSLKYLLKELKRVERKFLKGRRYKVRVLLNNKGVVNIEYSEIKRQDALVYVAISKYRVDSEDIFLYHKTTNRALYDREYAFYRVLGYYDVIFLNSRGEITEGSISNVIIKKNNNFYTPVFSSGLLAGIYRGYLLKKGLVKEKKITFSEFLSADKVYLSNSVRGMVEVRVKKSNKPVDK